MSASPLKYLILHLEWFVTFGNELEVSLAAEFGPQSSVTLILTHTNIEGEVEEMLRQTAETPRELQACFDEAESLDFILT